MHPIDRAIINELQHGLPITEHPFKAIAKQLNTSQDEIISRIEKMLDDGLLTRFGPLFNIVNMGGSYTLCALQVPAGEFEKTAQIVNQIPQVAHNYQREHRLNMWFVLATESPQLYDALITQLEQSTGLKVYQFPKQREYSVKLHFSV